MSKLSKLEQEIIESYRLAAIAAIDFCKNTSKVTMEEKENADFNVSFAVNALRKEIKLNKEVS